MARILSVSNQKGGVGKTTTAANLGAELVRQGKRVLLLDLDPQASLSQLFGVSAPEANVANVLGVLERGTVPLTQIVCHLSPGLDLAPSDILLSRTELALVVRPAREFQLGRALAPVAGDYDFILIDCPPSFGLLTLNALVASRAVIVPTQLDMMALRGLGLFVETLDDTRADYEQSAALLGVVATMADLRTTHARDVLTALRQREDLRLFETTIPRSIRFGEAASQRQPIAAYDPGSTGAAAYARLAEEVLRRAA